MPGNPNMGRKKKFSGEKKKFFSPPRVANSLFEPPAINVQLYMSVYLYGSGLSTASAVVTRVRVSYITVW